MMMLKSEYALCKCQVSEIESEVKDEVKDDVKDDVSSQNKLQLSKN